MAKLGVPDYKQLKANKVGAFFASIFPIDVVKANSTLHKMLRLFLEAAVSLAAIVNKIDAGEIHEMDIIHWQGIRNALLLLRNASQQHYLQQQKTIFQHLNPQLKSLIQDMDLILGS